MPREVAACLVSAKIPRCTCKIELGHTICGHTSLYSTHVNRVIDQRHSWISYTEECLSATVTDLRRACCTDNWQLFPEPDSRHLNFLRLLSSWSCTCLCLVRSTRRSSAQSRVRRDFVLLHLEWFAPERQRGRLLITAVWFGKPHRAVKPLLRFV